MATGKFLKPTFASYSVSYHIVIPNQSQKSNKPANKPANQSTKRKQANDLALMQKLPWKSQNVDENISIMTQMPLD